MNKTKKVLIAVIIVFFALLLCIYLGIAFYYRDKFYPGTRINQIDVSGMSADEAENIISGEITDYTLTVFDEEGTKEFILAAEYDLVYVSDGAIQNMLQEQNSFLWFINLWNTGSHPFTARTTYNEAKLRTRVEALSMLEGETTVEAQDAYITSQDGRYVIVDSITGSAINTDLVYSLVKEAVDASEPAVTLADYIEYNEPSVVSDDPALIAQMENLNNFLDFQIVHTFGSQEEILTGADIEDWIEIDDDFNITVTDTQRVADYVYSLASKYNTFGSSRTIQSSHGYPVVVEGGDYGWIINKDAETAALIEIIESGESATREPVYENTAYTHDGVDTGEPDTYIEIDLTSQHLWFYYNGTLIVESDIVSGTMDGDKDTRAGTFAVMFKESDYRLVGETWDRPVDFFVAFYTNVGLHDASWRDSFGGEIYKNSGSNGCVNMPRSAVEQIYNLVEKDMIVYCYY